MPLPIALVEGGPRILGTHQTLWCWPMSPGPRLWSMLGARKAECLGTESDQLLHRGQAQLKSEAQNHRPVIWGAGLLHPVPATGLPTMPDIALVRKRPITAASVGLPKELSEFLAIPGVVAMRWRTNGTERKKIGISAAITLIGCNPVLAQALVASR